jgi:hypothetical protein
VAQRNAAERMRTVQGPIGGPLNVACPTCKATVALYCMADPAQTLSGEAGAFGTFLPFGEYHPARQEAFEAAMRSANEDASKPPGPAPAIAKKADPPTEAAVASILEMGRKAEETAKRRPVLPAFEPEPEVESTDPFRGTIPDVFLVATFDSVELAKRVTRREAIGEARLAAKKRTISFCGVTGAGKTHLAAATLRYRAEIDKSRPKDLLFLSAMRLAFARARHPLGEGDPPEVDRALKSRLVVIDDLGGEQPVYSSPIPEILDTRYAMGLATWVTTWLTPDKMADRYGTGISRRVFGRTEIIDVGGAEWVKELRI